MLWIMFTFLLVLWALGWGFHVLGRYIHFLLVIALILLVVRLATGTESTEL